MRIRFIPEEHLPNRQVTSYWLPNQKSSSGMMVSQLYTLWRGKKLRDEVDSVFRSSLLEDVLYVALDRGERDEVSRRDLFICVAEEDVRQELDFCIREFVLVREAGSDRSQAIEILECLRMVDR